MSELNGKNLKLIKSNLLELKKINKYIEYSINNIFNAAKEMVSYADEEKIEEEFNDSMRLALQQRTQIDLFEKSLKQFAKGKPKDIADPVDVLVELSRTTAILFYEISIDSMSCLAIGICKKYELPDPDEILVTDIWEFRYEMACKLTDLIDATLNLKFGNTTLRQELNNKCLMSKLAGEKIPPDFYFKRLVELSLD